MTDLTAKLAENAKLFQRVIVSVGNCTYEEALAFKGASEAFSALQAVLAMGKHNLPSRIEEYKYKEVFKVGHEYALDQVRATIEGKVGK